jgi:alkylated DNA repair dioxygenase AlkB
MENPTVCTLYSYRKERLEVDFYHNFLDPETAQDLYQHLEKHAQWRRDITPGRRVNQNYGDDGVSYEYSLRGNLIHRPTCPWSELPVLESLRDAVSNVSRNRYNYCVVQRYPSGRVGINPHRDKEMKHGTDIAGLSLGATRVLTLTPPRFNRVDTNPINISLTPGSLYILRPPTNDYWTHSIEKDLTVTESRVSLTFRLNI